MPTLQSLDETVKPYTILIKGDSGGGKTYKAAQFPKPAIFNFDNNLSGLLKLPAEVRRNIKIVNPFLDSKTGKRLDDQKVWANFVAQLAEVCADPSVQTIIIDSLTTMAAILTDQILQSGDPSKRMEIQHWGDFSRYMKWFGEHLLCAPGLDKHIVVLAHESIKEDKLSGRVKYLLNIGGETKSNFDLYFTDCWRVYTKAGKDKTKPVEYWVRSLPTDYHTAKSSMTLPADFEWDTEWPKINQNLLDALRRN